MRDSIFENAALREAIAAKVRGDGFDTATGQDVLDVARYGSVDEGIIGEEYDEKLTDAILAELDERGIQV